MLRKSLTEFTKNGSTNQCFIADAFSERFGAALGCQMVDFGTQSMQDISKMAPKICQKCILIQGRECVFFFTIFWSPPRGPRVTLGVPPIDFGSHLATISLQNYTKNTSEKASKNRCRKSDDKYHKNIENVC